MQGPTNIINARTHLRLAFCIVRQLLQRSGRIHRDVAAVFRICMIRLSKPLPG